MKRAPYTSRPERAALPASMAQRRAIQIGRRQLGMDDPTYYLMLANHGGNVDSCKDLTRVGATQVLDHLKRIGFEVKPAKPSPSAGNVARMATPKQLALIDHLRAEVKWYHSDGFDRWRKASGLPKPRTKEAASTVIEALKKLKEHGHEA